MALTALFILVGLQSVGVVWLIWKQRTGTSGLHADVSDLKATTADLTDRVKKLESESGRMTQFREKVLDKLAKLDDLPQLLRDAIAEMHELGKALRVRDQQLQGEVTAIRRHVGMDPKYPGGQT